MENEQVLLDHPRTEWVATVNAGDVERYLARLTVDVSWIPPGQVALNGRRAFEAWGRPFFSRFTYGFSLDEVSGRVTGTWAVERGAFRSAITSASVETAAHTGCDVLLWRREAGEVWRIER